MPPDRDSDPADATLVPTSPAEGSAHYTPPSDADRTRAAGAAAGAGRVVVAGYEVEAELGRGGMGVVYRARQIRLDRPVALKMILGGFQASARDRARFQAEAAAVAKLRHQNIVQIYEVGEYGDRPYLALELVEGATLHELLAGAPQPTGPAAHLVEILARATHHAHARGVVHRDLKPSNVLLAPPPDGSSAAADPVAARVAELYGVPKITDFGLAKLTEGDSGQTRSGDLLGTPSYMAPEQAAGRAAEVGPAADVYSLGAILYELLTGRPPFRGATAMETVQQVLRDDPVPPGRLRPKLPRDLERVCLKCLEKDPARRYASALDLADDLRRHLNGESVHARLAPPHERVWRWCRRNPVPAVLMAAAVLGSVSGLFYLSWLTESVARSTAVQGAAQQSETLDEVNKYYGKIAGHTSGKRVGPGWEDVPGAIPIPATMTIELSQQITARSETGTTVRLYSDYPFRTRADGGPHDDFERVALDELRRDPKKPFYRFEDLGGGTVLRYATARTMSAQACVNCHNTHPDSTKTDWQVGDVRGVLEVIRPLDRDQERVSHGLRGTAFLVAGLGLGVIGLSAVTLAFTTRRRAAPAAAASDSGGGKASAARTPPAPPSSPPEPARGGPPMPEPRRPRPDQPPVAPTPPLAADSDATLAPGVTDHPPAAEATAHPTVVAPPRPAASVPDVTLVAPPVRGAATPRDDSARTLATPALPGDATRPAASRGPDSDGTVPLFPPNASATTPFGDPSDALQSDPAGDFDATLTAPGSTPAAGGRAAPSPSERGAMVGRFALRGLHAKGGLGEVYTARDTELNREVALKRIQARFADEPGSRSRFLSEAQITARLDHPGVVPVFGLVADPFGRPCYAMRFIRGASMKDEIDRFHGKGARGPGSEKTQPDTGAPAPEAPAPEAPHAAVSDTDERRLAFRQLLQRFIAVCQAIAYAHSKGVIHRDIKPANVMVGAFGETLVVDWGLAKVLGDAPTPDDLLKKAAAAGYRRDADATELPDDMTQAGTAVGTPAYMSPEQAAGRVDLVGPPADVYSLGATLYSILTGTAPFTGTNPSDTIGRVQSGDFPPPRAVSAEVPRPLDAICLKAMAGRIEDRYPTAAALAEDVERWLSDEPVTAYRDPLTARVFRWVRRHPARVAATASLLLTALVATGVVLTVVDQARQRTKESLARVTRAEAETKQALAEVTTAQTETKHALAALTTQEARTREQRDAAEAARDLARDRFRLASTAFDTVVFGVQARLEDRAGTQELRKELLQSAQAGLQRLLDTVATSQDTDRQDADRLLLWARLQMGDVQKGLGSTTAAIAEYEAAVKVADGLAADPNGGQTRNGLAMGYDRLADVYLQAGRTAAAFDAAGRALAIRRDLLAATPADHGTRRDVAASQDRLAAVEVVRGHTREARAACTAALAARKELYAADAANVAAARDLAQSHERDAEILLLMGDTAAAATAVRDALALRTTVAKTLADRTEVARELATAHALLGAAEYDRADMAGSLKAYRDGLAVLEGVLARDPLSAGSKTDAAIIHGRIAFVLLKSGDAAGSLAAARRGNAMCTELVAADAGSAKLRRALARSHQSIGDALLASGRAADALKEYEAARAILDALDRADPGTVRGRADTAENAERLGNAQLAAGNLTAAIDHFCNSAAAREELVQQDDGSARARRQLGVSFERLCDAHLTAGNGLQARVAAYRALALFKGLAEADPGSGQARRDLAVAYQKWGEVAFRQDDRTAAMILWHKSLGGFDAVLAVDPTNAQALEDKATALERLATIHGAAGYPDAQLAAEEEALALREKAAAKYPASAASHRGLMASKRRVGDVYANRGRLDVAAKYYAEARAVAAKFADDPVFAPELALLADRSALAAAVRAGLTNPLGMARDTAAGVRERALAVVLETHLTRNEPVNAGRAAGLLADYARTPDDLYRAARGYAVAAARSSGEARKAFAAAALEALAAAATAGFRDATALEGATWNALRDRPEFQATLAAVRALPPLAPPPRAK